MSLKNTNVLLIGSGYMAREYLLVLVGLQCNVTIVGRGEEKIALLKAEFPQFTYYSGGLENYLISNDSFPSFAINAVNVNHLRNTSLQLLNKGIKYILIEKPGDISTEGLEEIRSSAIKNEAQVSIAYNRRYYSSVIALKEHIMMDGGVRSVHFEFTEWVHTIDPSIYDSYTLGKWITANSSHVIDTVVSIIGLPEQLNANVQGLNEISWHPSGSVFTGNGVSRNKVPFTYHSDWLSAGRWSIEIMTKKRRFYLKPMEKLQVQNRGSVAIEEVNVDDTIDKEFKPGLYLLTESFLSRNTDNLVNLDDQIVMNSFYDKIGNY
ncbi:hypothetical protein [Pedobacter polysacchareus]|uniref:hypothetical protein n=1 Tax=Pedobacter polysacchareus TaxID=2861973 RepID=UPI001C99B48A|nr:hypothetical protein [Pedobacter polysacchareus]